MVQVDIIVLRNVAGLLQKIGVQPVVTVKLFLGKLEIMDISIGRGGLTRLKSELKLLSGLNQGYGTHVVTYFVD